MARLARDLRRAANILASGFIITGALAGCGDTGPTTRKIGKDTYGTSVRVLVNGPSGAKGQAFQDANGFCEKLGRHMLLYHEHSYECALSDGCGVAVVYFLCLSEEDPRYKVRYLRPLDEGVYTIESW